MSATVWVTGWSNGSPTPTGAGYGVRLTKEDRDLLIRRSWRFVTIDLPDGTESRPDVDGKAFWNTCPELRSAAIGRWMLKEGLAPWPSGSPPRLRLTLVSEARFKLER